jgi:murein DD-endopeptidase MepM/ murein hydrolase activator NlpD
MMASNLYRGRNKSRKPFFLFIFFGIILIGSGLAGFIYLERETPLVDISEELGLIGTYKEVTFTVTDQKSGLSHADVTLVQGAKQKKLNEKNFQREGYAPSAGPDQLQLKAVIDAKALNLKNGSAQLVVTARDFSYWNFLRGNKTERVYEFTLDTEAPKVNRMDSPRYIKPGGAGIVIYKISETVANHGVRVNGFFHAGFPLPGAEGTFGAIIGLPYYTENIESAAVEAVDKAGNIGKAPFGMILKTVKWKHDKINVPDSFLSLKIPEFSQYYPQMEGDMIAKYLYVNNTVRSENNKRIMEICNNSGKEQFWAGKFGRMARSSNRAGYADHRTYYYNGKEIDKQVHLGIDLASTRHAEVLAANRGKVIFADYLGIYGNMVVLDHGLGVFSLYSHLSQIGVVEGDIVEKNGVLGATGTSGMAGGDHLHFSMLVNGVLVDPLEWWDEHWLDLNILSYLK